VASKQSKNIRNHGKEKTQTLYQPDENGQANVATRMRDVLVTGNPNELTIMNSRLVLIDHQSWACGCANAPLIVPRRCTALTP